MKTMKAKLFALVLALALCLSAVPAQAALWDAPAEPATREMVVTALWDIEGQPVVNYAMPFTDVREDASYAEAVRWAASEQIISGVGGGRFQPEGAVTREMFAVMLYRYAISAGMDVSVGEETNILSYNDFLDRSDWAVSALQWTVGTGILADQNGNLNARNTVTQAEAAAILEAFAALPAGTGALSSWTDAASAKTALTAYITAATDPDSPDFIPAANRIAVFDLDGTLMCETYPRCFEYMVFVDYVLNNPGYTPTEEIRAVAQEILDTAWQEKPSGISTRQAAAAAVAYEGMTPGELMDYVTEFMSSDAEGFTGLKRGEAFYKPMVELVEYLEDNGFTIYIVTATERNIVRALVKDTLGIPPARVIGTEYGYTATGQGDAADGDYTFQSTDKVVFDGNYYGENAKMSKVDAIVREIGQQPVLAFGNSSGDVAMCEYTVTNNPHPALSYIVLADDEVREWGDAESARGKIAGYEALGIGTISMRDDFATIYGDGVKKDAGAPTGGSPEQAGAAAGEARQITAEKQSIGLTSVGNARELGGYAMPDGRMVKRGVLLRTASLANASDADIKRLQDEYHLSTVIDLRMTREVEAQPDPEINGVKNLHIGIIDEQALAQRTAELDPSELAGYDPNDKMSGLKIAMKLGIVGEQMYVNFLSGDQGKAGYRQMFEELLSLPEGESLLFHCTQGKDRTGCAAMLILSALGADEDTIIQDFALTNTFNAELIEGERNMLIEAGYAGEELQTLMRAMDEVDPQYMRNAIDWLKENYGSVIGYITQELGITDGQLETLKKMYLE